MTIAIKDVIKRAAYLLGVAEQVESYLAGNADEEGKRECALLLKAFQTVENEVALDYLPLTAEEELVTATGVVRYVDFERRPVRIFCVEDEWGNSLKYELFPDYLKAQAGKWRVYYAYAPQVKTIEEACEHQTGVSERLFAYGVAAEYALTVGELTNAAVWDKKYKEALRAAYRLRPSKRLRSRRWV